MQSENGLMIFLFSFSFSIFFHPSPANVFVHTNWETARLCPAAFAKEPGCKEVTNRAVAAQSSVCYVD